MLETAFLRLPLRFDSGRLAAEAASLEPAASIPLVAPGGDPAASARGAMRPTPQLARYPYARQVLAALGTVLGRTRLVRAAGPGEASARSELDYSVAQRVRVLVPLVLSPGVEFVDNGRALHPAVGECWVCDPWRPHAIRHTGPYVFLAADTVGSAAFWNLVATASGDAEPVPIPFAPGREPDLETEAAADRTVMSPWEQESLIVRVLDRVAGDGVDAGDVARLEALLEGFHREWRAAWARFGDTPAGRPTFGHLLGQLDRDLPAFAGRVPLDNGLDAVDALRRVVVRPGLELEPGGAAAGLGPAAAVAHRAAREAAPPAAPVAGTAELRSVHTRDLADILDRLGISLLVTTYQAGKLIVVRADGGRVNTHFRSFPTPMGLALSGDRLALGTRFHLWDLRNQPAVAARLPPAGRHDAAFLPRACHFTGDIRVHELAFAAGGLWVVNTRFSCLSTLDPDHSFVPRWRPPFVSALAPEDRCHLNGLAVRDGRPAYVTCLGRTDTVGGWRANKRDGGLLLDVPGGEVVLAGLSMPHSPRWHDGRLWVLESGRGTLSVVDPRAGRAEPVAVVPGFTRGLDFHGPYAFVGLSQVRETAVFSGLPITEELKERACGVWAIDLQTGRTAGFLRFEAGVQEVFAIQVLPGVRFPDVATEDEEVVGNSFVLPDEALPLVPAAAGGRPVP